MGINKKQLIVIGGGAAGFFCAINAAQMNRNLSVLLLEKTGKLLSKVKVSGGGRCNVTHACFDIADMAKCYPRGANFVKKIFHQFFVIETIEWFKQRKVLLKTEADGRMFPTTDNSQTIVDCLLNAAASSAIVVRTHCGVARIEKINEAFIVTTSTNEKIEADFICLATGGFSKTTMFDWLKNLDHCISTPVPSIFTFNLPDNAITKLMGVTVDNVAIKIKGTKWQQIGSLLITHWGLSGPVILKLSAYAARELADMNWEFEILINWLPQHNEQSLKEKLMQLRSENGAYLLYHKNSLELPQRLWIHFLNDAKIPEKCRRADLSSKQVQQIVHLIVAHQIKVSGKTTFKEEFVTAGGISLQEIDANSMMSKKIPNLFFAGEIIDVDGITGGYNFQNAWSTGFVAATSITRGSKS